MKIKNLSKASKAFKFFVTRMVVIQKEIRSMIFINKKRQAINKMSNMSNRKVPILFNEC